MKRKVKRFDEGGEAELKKRGLEESKNERVGFFERLRMGNIDKPGSEAYEKFGAGRGRAAETAQRESEAAKSGPLGVKSEYTGTRFGQPEVKAETKPEVKETRMPVGLLSATTPQGEGEGGKPPPRVYPDKDNDDIKPKPKPKKTKPSKVSSGASGFDVDEEGIEKRRAESAKDKKGPTGRLYKAFKGTAESTGRRYSESNPFAKRMAGGGKVSSASSRADGIAQRGKTRGRIV